jgi:hypothetical protein
LSALEAPKPTKNAIEPEGSRADALSMARTPGDGRGSALPRSAERLVPWLAAAIFIGCVNVVVGLAGVQPSLAERAAMIFALCASLAMAGLVASRSRRATIEADLQERARPARDELLAFDGGVDHADTTGSSTYLESMERWAGAMLELTEHAAASAAAQEHEAAAELAAAAEDTREFQDLLRATAEAPVSAKGMATVHSVCTLWEADQDHIEALCTSVDAAWHRRWRARSVVDRLVRHGGRKPHETVFPYSS